MIVITRDEAMYLQKQGFTLTKTKTKYYATEDSKVLYALKVYKEQKEKN